MLFIMEGIDLAGVVDSDFQGIQINFAPPRPAPQDLPIFVGRDKTCFFAGRGSPFSAGRGGAGRTSLIVIWSRLQKIGDCHISHTSLPLVTWRRAGSYKARWSSNTSRGRRGIAHWTQKQDPTVLEPV